MEWIKRIKALVFPTEEKPAFDLKEAMANNDQENLRLSKIKEEVKE